MHGPQSATLGSACSPSSLSEMSTGLGCSREPRRVSAGQGFRGREEMKLARMLEAQMTRRRSPPSVPRGRLDSATAVTSDVWALNSSGETLRQPSHAFARASWQATHRFPPALGLFLLQSASDLPHVVAVRFGQAIPNSSSLFDNCVTGHDDHSVSSSGVQMIGGSNPAPRHVRSILSRIAAFAMCVQFHVNT